MSDPDHDDENLREKVLGIARSARVCMVTVSNGADDLLSRPMAPQEVTDEGVVWFLIDTTGDQATQVMASPAFNLAFVDSSTWLSISGEGEVLSDKDKVEALWSSAAEAWFPTGPDDSRLGVLRVRGKSAEYWDEPGGRIATVLSFIKANATGDTLSADNEAVRLS